MLEDQEYVAHTGDPGTPDIAHNKISSWLTVIATCSEGGIWRNMIEHEKYGGITNMYPGKNMGGINLLQNEDLDSRAVQVHPT